MKKCLLCFFIAAGLMLCPRLSAAGEAAFEPEKALSPAFGAQTPRPEITKHPGRETLTEGDSCLFTARANNATDYYWFFKYGGTEVSAKEAPGYFPPLTVSGLNTEIIELKNVPTSLDGWQIFCTFSGPGGSVTSEGALINVNERGSAASEPSSVPAQSAEPQRIAEPTGIIPGSDFEMPIPNDAAERNRRGNTIFSVAAVIIAGLLCGTVLYLNIVNRRG